MDPTDVCVILICNSQSRIHPKLRQRLLRIRYDPPRNSEKITDIFSILTRGDLRLTSKKSNVNQRIWNYLNCHEDELEKSVLEDDTIDIQTILIEIILLGQTLHILNDTLMSKINAIYPLIVDGTMLFEEINTIMIDILKTFRNLVRSSV
jgi:DNA polymerase III delta prime subunit